MSRTKWYVGGRVRASVTFKDIQGQPADPTSVVAKFQDGGGSETTRTYPTGITKVSTGNYYTDIDITGSGTWYVRWNGTGAVVAAVEEAFSVLPSQF
jgi:hypothetical protein